MQRQIGNPFIDSSPLNQPLSVDLCQRIYFEGWSSAISLREKLGPDFERIANNDIISDLRRKGPNILIPHQAYVREIFAGVTTSVFQTVKHLYCDWIARAPRIVSLILDRLADTAVHTRIHPEAVLILCAYLHPNRVHMTNIKVLHEPAHWQFGQFSLPYGITSGQVTVNPAIDYVLDTTLGKILAFEVNLNMPDASAINIQDLVLYQAISNQRMPSVEGKSHIFWVLPEEASSSSGFSAAAARVLKQCNVRLSDYCYPVDHPMLDHVKGNWTDDIKGTHSRVEFTAIFDTYLRKIHGFGPLAATQQKDQDYSHLIFYNREPAHLVPLLRPLLPLFNGRIIEGTIEQLGMHYEDELFKYFPDTEVTLRISPYNQSIAWVYLDEEILCMARPKELRQMNGDYRKHLI